MVRALLDGRKTQTRRILKDQPGDLDRHGMFDNGEWYVMDSRGGHQSPLAVRFRKRDRLWVKENWLPDPPRGDDAWDDWCSPVEFDGCGLKAAMVPPALRKVEHAIHQASWTGTPLRWKPSIHMPRWASRLTLTVTDVRVQRLQDCSDDDAIAEGIERRSTECSDGVTRGLWYGVPECGTEHAVTSYSHLWEAINNPSGLCADDAPNSWDANPWIVALTFTVERRNIDALPMPYLIWSNVHGAWWGANRAGYYTELSSAGRYTREEAIAQCANGRDGFTAHRTPPELPVREIDAINRGGRRIEDVVLKADRAECRARDLASKAKVPA